MLGAGKNQRKRILVGGKQLLEQSELAARLNKMGALGNLVGALARCCHLNADRILEINGGDLVHLLGHGGRKQKRLARLADKARNLAQCMDEAEIEHLVGFVEHEVLCRIEPESLALDEIEQTARRCHDDVAAMSQRLDLRSNGHAAHDGIDLDGRTLGEGAQIDSDLVHQFAGRREDQGLAGLGIRLSGLGQKLLNDGKAECGGLAGAGLGKAHDIAAFKDERDCPFLDGRGIGKAQPCDGFKKMVVKAEGLKLSQIISFSGSASCAPNTTRLCRANLRVARLPLRLQIHPNPRATLRTGRQTCQNPA